MKDSSYKRTESLSKSNQKLMKNAQMYITPGVIVIQTQFSIYNTTVGWLQLKQYKTTKLYILQNNMPHGLLSKLALIDLKLLHILQINVYILFKTIIKSPNILLALLIVNTSPFFYSFHYYTIYRINLSDSIKKKDTYFIFFSEGQIVLHFFYFV